MNAQEVERSILEVWTLFKETDARIVQMNRETDERIAQSDEKFNARIAEMNRPMSASHG